MAADAVNKIRTPIHYRIEHRIAQPSESPGLPFRHDTLYIVSELSRRKHVVFKCPNKDCTGIIHIDVEADKKPHWALTEHMDWTISLHPTISHACGTKFHIDHGSANFSDPD